MMYQQVAKVGTKQSEEQGIELNSLEFLIDLIRWVVGDRHC